MYLIKLAFRNVFRNRRRSLLAVSSVMLAVTFMVLINGMISGVMESLVKNSTKNQTGHVRISTKAFQEKSNFLPVDENLSGLQTLRQLISETDTENQVDLVTPRIQFGVVLDHDGKNQTAIATAGDLEEEKELMMLQGSISQGRYIEGPREVIIGETLANALNYKIGDQLKLMTQASDYSLRMRKFLVVGLFKTGVEAMDKNLFQIPLSDARKLLRMDNEESQQLLVMLKHYTESRDFAQALQAKIDAHPEFGQNIKAQSWTEIGDTWFMINNAKQIYKFIYVIISFLGAIIIGNIMMMVVLERSHEIGVLKSMGMSKGDILKMFLMEGTILGTAGTLTGLIPAIGLSLWLAKTGVDFSSMTKGINMPIDNIIYWQLEWSTIGMICFLGITVSAALSFLPARRGAALNPVEAIKSL